MTVAAAVLLAMGRHPFCECGIVRIWTSDTQSAENSQQLLDPYSFTHVTHGLLLYGLLRVIAARRTIGHRALMAIALESLWEVIENTDAVIERYRAATLALGYFGDSVFNSLGDILMCAVGFALAARCRTSITVAVAIGLELMLLFWIRDNLTLNLIMLAWPIEALKQWQLGP